MSKFYTPAEYDYVVDTLLPLFLKEAEECNGLVEPDTETLSLTKSTICSIMFPVWVWTRMPDSIHQ